MAKSNDAHGIRKQCALGPSIHMGSMRSTLNELYCAAATIKLKNLRKKKREEAGLFFTSEDSNDKI